MISARIIADSKNEFGNRLTTFVLTMPRIVLAEAKTHRIISLDDEGLEELIYPGIGMNDDPNVSKNSASSRAIPFEKMLKSVEENPFIPLRWQKDHSGMQGTEYFTEEDDKVLLYGGGYHSKIDSLKERWLAARDAAVAKAKDLHDLGLTKQLCNRLLEPWLYHTVIATASEWGNFFALRAHKDAEIHIQDLAYKMLDAYNASDPVLLKAGEWHIPFGDNINLPSPIPIEEGLTLDEGVAFRKVMVATARCARVSYNNFEGKDDYNADIKLYHRLLESGHLSPFEHCAQSMSNDEYEYYGHNLAGNTMGCIPYLSEPGWCGNFQGFIQLRKTIEGENKSDSRIILK